MVKLPQLSQIPNSESDRISPFKPSEITTISGRQPNILLPSPQKINIKTLDSRQQNEKSTGRFKEIRNNQQLLIIDGKISHINQDN